LTEIVPKELGAEIHDLFNYLTEASQSKFW